MKGETVTCNDGRVIEDHGQTIRIVVPMELRKRSGRKVIVEPDTPHDDNEPSPLVVALARAYVWQQAIDRGDFPNAQELNEAASPRRQAGVFRLLPWFTVLVRLVRLAYFPA